MEITAKKVTRIGIIGGGIIGFSVGNIIQQRHSNVEIELTTSKCPNLTTSWGAPGSMRLNLNENKFENTLRWYTKGKDHFWKLFRSNDCVNAGVLISDTYYISDKPIELPDLYGDIYHGFRSVNSKELSAIGFHSDIKYGVSFLTPTIESRYYLKYLSDNFTNNGGRIISETIQSGKQNVANWAVKKQYDIIVNCSGLGARELFEDNQILPLRGQLVRVKAPWFKYSFVTTDDTYALNCRESVVLGGFRQKNDWDLSIRPNETRNILDRIRSHNVCLSESEIVEEWAGLRPWRPNLRLEIEYIQSSDGIVVPVIHNYGHGSSGVGLSWGTSLEAVDLIDRVLPNVIHSKL